MKLLLCKNVSKLGIVGDVVNVSSGYARNYLIPHGVATEPTEANVRKLAEARALAEQERIRERGLLESLAQRIEGVEITIRAKANEDGILYGSVGSKDIAAALLEEGFPIEPEQVQLDGPIRHLDTVAVTIKLAEDLDSTVKAWIVREKTDQGDDDEESREAQPGTEAGSGDDHAAP